MTTVKIKDNSLPKTVKIKNIHVGELFRYESDIYIMTDEGDGRGNKLGMLITEDDTLGMLSHFGYNENVTRLDGTISVEIN